MDSRVHTSRDGFGKGSGLLFGTFVAQQLPNGFLNFSGLVP
jgi:hypothetical protein